MSIIWLFMFLKTVITKADAVTYAKYLIKANNSQIADSQIDTLLEDAKTKSANGKTANSKKGISVGYLETDEYYEYQVLRTDKAYN